MHIGNEVPRLARAMASIMLAFALAFGLIPQRAFALDPAESRGGATIF